MDVVFNKPKAETKSEIYFQKVQISEKRSEFCENLSLYEKGQISSFTNPSIDKAIFNDIVPHGDIPWLLYDLVYQRSSLVFNAINNTADFAIQAGFDFDSSADAKKKIMKWMKETDFKTRIMKNIFIGLQKDGIVPLDVSNIKFPKILPARTMYIKVIKGGNDDGKPIGYRQVIPNQYDKPIDFSLEEIVWFVNNDAINPFYGMSEIKPVLGALTRYANWQEDLGVILHYFSAPYIHWLLGTENFPANATQIADFEGLLAGRKTGEDIVTSSAVKHEVIQASQGMMQMDGLVKGLQDEIIAGLRIPEIFVRGGVTANKAVGDVEMQAFDRKVHALQEIVSSVLEKYLFPKLTTGDVEMVWNEFSAEGELVRAQRLKAMREAGIPLNTALQMVGWGTWTDDVKKDLEDEMENMPEFNKDEKSVIKQQKESLRYPLKEAKK
jgi:hypothetical protein